MKKLIITGFLGGLVILGGCTNKTEEIVRGQLKDPSSAEFKDVKGNCGFVNAKNSFGGYTGFKRFYVSNDVVSFQGDDDDNSMKFDLGWIAHCERDSQLPQDEIDRCISFGNFAAAVIRSKQAGVSYATTSSSITADSDASKNSYAKVIDEGYRNYDDPNKYAVKILLDCLSGKIKAPL